MPAIATYQIIPFDYSRNAQQYLGPKAFVQTFTMVANVKQYFSASINDIGLDYIPSMFVDNSDAAAGHLQIHFTGTDWIFKSAPGLQGFYPAIIAPGILDFNIVTTGSGIVKIFWINKEQMALSWAT